ncbi:RNA-directed DNA polymerase, eukaryota [Tanacetum coccineum]
MGSFRTKEDDVANISMSVFITNFPKSCSTKELFQSCKQYGHVVDTFIPTKRSKNGRRFGFVRFINVFNEERLMNNLCMVWIDRFKLHANIARKAVSNEGFVDIKIRYMGELWVLLEFGSEDSMKLFQDNVEGIPFKLWTDNTFKRIATKWGELLDIDDQGVMAYPPGFTPKEGSEEIGMYAEESKSVNFVNLSDHKAEEANKDGHGNCVNKNSKEDVSSSVCSGHFKKSGVPRTGGSILNLMDELVKVGQVIGYKMDGCMSNMTEIIESQGVKEVNFMALQETKMENMELFSVKMCWGNFAFDYVHSDSVGNSRGILCVWDPNSFRKRNATVNDYFVMIQGVGKYKSKGQSTAK